MPRCWKRSAPNWTATIARGWKRSARRSDRVFRHAGLVPASNPPRAIALEARSEEHTSELQSLMRISYAVFCLQKKKITDTRLWGLDKLEGATDRTLTQNH